MTAVLGPVRLASPALRADDGKLQTVPEWKAAWTAASNRSRTPSPTRVRVILPADDPCIFGDPTLQADNWKAHNPVDLAAELRGVSLFVASGNGLPGRYDDAESASPADPLEILVHQMSENFVAALDRNQVPVTTWFYGNGIHPTPATRFYDYDDLRRFLPQAMSALNRK